MNASNKKKTLVLDMNGTLILLSNKKQLGDRVSDFTFTKWQDKANSSYLYMRPHLKDFLKMVSKAYEVIFYCASLPREIVQVVIALFQKLGLFPPQQVLLREQCCIKTGQEKLPFVIDPALLLGLNRSAK